MASPAVRVLNASNQNLSKIARITCPGPRSEVAVLNADGNHLAALTGLQCYPSLIQLSACNNSIVKMDAIHCASSLVTLNLQGNSISDIVGLEGLQNLQWVSLAGNTIANMDGLSLCTKLNYLDLSENCIAELSDITSLSYLKTLLLHGNALGSLRSVPKCLPRSITTLSLAENEVSDLNEVSFLQGLHNLEQMSLLNNPCVAIVDARMFDFRPYVLYWCPKLTSLDGVDILPEEKQSAGSLFPPGKPYPFNLGEHHVLVHYLSSIYPLITTSNSLPDLRPPTAPVVLNGPQAEIPSKSVETLKAVDRRSQTLSPTRAVGNTLQTRSPSKTEDKAKSPSRSRTPAIIRSPVRAPASPGSTGVPSRNTAAILTPSTAATNHISHTTPIPTLSTASIQTPSMTSPKARTSRASEVTTKRSPSMKSMEVSLSELESLLTQSSSADHSGLVQKLRALQLVEQMIATQEQLITSKDAGVARASPVRSALGPEVLERQETSPEQLGMQGRVSKLVRDTEKHSVKPIPREVTAEASSTSQPHPPFGTGDKQGRIAPKSTYVETGSSPSGGGVLARNHSLSSSSGYGSSLSQAGSSSSSLTLQERKQQQLKLINEKLVKRHSKLHQAVGDKHQQLKGSRSVESVGGEEFSSERKEVLMTTASMQPTLSQELPGKSVAWTVNSVLDPSSTKTNTGVLPTGDPLPKSFSETDVLDSETSFLPVSPAGCAEQVLNGAEIIHEPDSGDTDYYITSLLSSLNSAYGYSSLAEKSRLLSSLVRPGDAASSDTHPSASETPDGKDYTLEAVKIQSAFRGYLARKECRKLSKQVKAATLIQAVWRGYVARKRDPEAIRVCAELSKIKMESHVHSLQSELKSCRSELAQQVRMSRLQGQTLQTLFDKVEELEQWRREVKEKERVKAALVLQRHWRGYRVRKEFGCSVSVFSRKQALWNFCCTLQNQVDHLASRLADLCQHPPAHPPAHPEAHHASQTAGQLPCVSDLQMTHYSDVCVLLRWTHPVEPSVLPEGPSDSTHSSTTTRLGYRVYVNGVAEGMVGPDKLQAYIEGLDMGTTYRLTVRVLYSSGESKDSNPIIASLCSSVRRSSFQSNSSSLPTNSDPSLPELLKLPVPEGGPDSSEQPPMVASGTTTIIDTNTDSQFHHQLTGNNASGSQSSGIPWSAADLGENSSLKRDLGFVDVGEKDHSSSVRNTHNLADKLEEFGEGGPPPPSPPPHYHGLPVVVDPSGKGHVSRVSLITRSTSSVIGEGSGGSGNQQQLGTEAVDGSLTGEQSAGNWSLSPGKVGRKGDAGFNNLITGRQFSKGGGEGCLAGKGDSSGAERNGQLKPSPGKPSVERVAASGGQPLTTASLLYRTSLNSASPPIVASVHSKSPHVPLSLLQQPITSTSLVGPAVTPLPPLSHGPSHSLPHQSPSHPYQLHHSHPHQSPSHQSPSHLPHLAHSPSRQSPSHHLLDSESVAAVEQVPSLLLNEALLLKAKQPPTSAVTDVFAPSVAKQADGFLQYSDVLLQPGFGNKFRESSVTDDNSSTGSITYRVASKTSKEEVFSTTKEKGVSPGDDSTEDKGYAAALKGSLGTRDLFSYPLPHSFPPEASSCDPHAHGMQQHQQSTPPRDGGGDDSGTSGAREQRLEGGSPANKPGAKCKETLLDCKQAPKLPADSQQCFEADRVACSLPREDSDSISSLVEATAATTDNTRITNRSRQTMPSALFKEGAEEVGEAFKCEAKGGGGTGAGVSDYASGGGGGKEVEVQGKSGEEESVLNSSGSSSQLMASLLLSQLESELTQSLHTQDNN